MIINPFPKFRTTLVTKEKKNLFRSGRGKSSLLISLKNVVNLLDLALRMAREYKKSIKKSFFIIILALILISLVEIHLPGSEHTQYRESKEQSSILAQEKPEKIGTPKIEDSTFNEFKLKYNKEYLNAQEEVFRSIVFLKNRNKINYHNSNQNRKFNMALNLFADLTPIQFGQIYNTLYKSDHQIQAYAKQLVNPQQQNQQRSISQPTNSMHRYGNYIQDSINRQLTQRKIQIANHNSQFISLTQILYPTINESFASKKTKYKWKYPPLKQSLSLTNESFLATNLSIISSSLKLGNFSQTPIDWTLHAGKIRYQGICGACYTFATSDAVASLYSIYKFGFFVPFSTQQVVDCSNNGLTYGCNGGFLEGSYAYMQMRGVQTDTNYPYVSTVSGIQGTCKRDGGSFKITSFNNVQEGDCTALVNQLNYGPVSIGIAGYRLQFYGEGIFNDCNSYVDHAVVLLGYKAGVGWKIKNSWGPEWGMDGFAWIADGNNCGICNMAVAANL